MCVKQIQACRAILQVMIKCILPLTEQWITGAKKHNDRELLKTEGGPSLNCTNK